MAYVTEIDIMGLMPQLPKTSTAAYSSASVLIALAISEAEGLIDGKIARKYALPFTSVPTQIRAIAKQLAVYTTYNYLYSGDNMNSNPYAERFEKFQENALVTLEKINNGDISLTLTNGALVSPRAAQVSIRSTHEDYTPTFDVGSELDQKIDTNLLNDIAAEKN